MQAVLVDQIVRGQGVDQHAAAVDGDVPAGPRLQGADLLDRVARIRVELRQAEAVASVEDTTYFGIRFMRSPNGSPAAMGSNAPPWICQVLRPRSSASLRPMAWKEVRPDVASCPTARSTRPGANHPGVLLRTARALAGHC